MMPHISVLVAASESGIALDQSTALFPEDILPLTILFLAALFWMVLAVWAMRQRGHAASARQIAERANNFSAAIFKSAPVGYLLFDRVGSCKAGGNAQALLGLADICTRLEDLCPDDGMGGLTPEAMAALEAQLNTPAQTSRPIMLTTRDGHVLKLSRALDYVDPDRLDRLLFWLEDETEHLTQAKAREIALKADTVERQRLRAVIDAAPFPIWLRGENLDLVLVNQAYVRAVEKTSAQEVISAQTEIVNNALTGSSRDSAARARDADEIVHERHFAVIGGERRALSLTDKPVGDLIAGYAVDVTEAEEKRAELARVIDGHAETLNSLSSPVAIFDADQKLQFFNSAFSRLFRLSDDWLMDRPDHASLLEAMREKRRLPEQADFRAWRTEQLDLHHNPDSVEELWHLPDGSTLRMVGQPHPLGGLLLLFEDVTDKLALESSYNALIAVQRETLNNLHEAVAVFGSDGRLKLFNPTYADIWSLDADILISEPHFGDILDLTRDVLYQGSDWPAMRERLLGQMSEQRAHSGRWHRPDGRVIDYAIVPLPDGRTLTTHMDVTDSVHMEHALRDRNEALETADRLKSEFVANMSYELRTPLNSIIGFSEMLMTEIYGPLADKQKNYLSYVLSAAAELRDLIDDILDLAVIEAGEMNLNIKNMDVRDLVEHSVAISREQARKAGVILEYTVEDSCGTIEGDPRRLTQAVFNLVGNAIKFTPKGGHVRVLARPHGSSDIELVVSDTGMGISSEDQATVFKKFSTGSDVHSRKGMGLGLSLVQSFIELHCGTVDLVSAPHEGTTVTCLLPRHQTATPDKAR